MYIGGIHDNTCTISSAPKAYNYFLLLNTLFSYSPIWCYHVDGKVVGFDFLVHAGRSSNFPIAVTLLFWFQESYVTGDDGGDGCRGNSARCYEKILYFNRREGRGLISSTSIHDMCLARQYLDGSLLDRDGDLYLDRHFNMQPLDGENTNKAEDQMDYEDDVLPSPTPQGIDMPKRRRRLLETLWSDQCQEDDEHQRILEREWAAAHGIDEEVEDIWLDCHGEDDGENTNMEDIEMEYDDEVLKGVDTPEMRQALLEWVWLHECEDDKDHQRLLEREWAIVHGIDPDVECIWNDHHGSKNEVDYEDELKEWNEDRAQDPSAVFEFEPLFLSSWRHFLTYYSDVYPHPRYSREAAE
jgi:hypothetical protein